MNDAWSAVSRVIVLKCWIESQCLNVQHTQCLNSITQNLKAADDVDIEITVPDSWVSSESYNVVDQQVVQYLPNALSRREFTEDEPRAPLFEILEKVSGIKSEFQLFHALNSTSPFDAQT